MAKIKNRDFLEEYPPTSTRQQAAVAERMRTSLQWTVGEWVRDFSSSRHHHTLAMPPPGAQPSSSDCISDGLGHCDSRRSGGHVIINSDDSCSFIPSEMSWVRPTWWRSCDQMIGMANAGMRICISGLYSVRIIPFAFITITLWKIHRARINVNSTEQWGIKDPWKLIIIWGQHIILWLILNQ